MQDLVGIRIVTLFEEDLSKISKCINDIFIVQREYNTADRLQKDQFGYSSIHKIITLPEEWLNIPTLQDTEGIKAELQLRTAPQHIWAEASNILNYKKEEDVPESIIRTIYRVSALLETVDLEFTKLINQKRKYRDEISTLDKEELLNVDILEKVLDEELPSENKKDSELYADLLQDLKKFEIETVGNLQELLRENYDQIIDNEKERLEEIISNKEDNQEVYMAAKDRINDGIFYSHVGLTREGLSEKFGEDWVDYNLAKVRN